MSNIIDCTESTFKETLQSNTPVLADFWAAWCGPCKMLAPILIQVSDHYDEKLKVVKIDIDANPNVAAEYNVRSIPTLILFLNRKVVAIKTGVQTKEQLIKFVDEHLPT
jgi:thioredoxin 1